MCISTVICAQRVRERGPTGLMGRNVGERKTQQDGLGDVHTAERPYR